MVSALRLFWRINIIGDPLNPSTLFNPLRGMHYGPWSPRRALVRFVWRTFFQNLRYELISRHRYRRMAERR